LRRNCLIQPASEGFCILIFFVTRMAWPRAGKLLRQKLPAIVRTLRAGSSIRNFNWLQLLETTVWVDDDQAKDMRHTWLIGRLR